MAKTYTKAKYKTIIKAFLCANKGKKFTARELANFVNDNEFALNNTCLTPAIISKMIKYRCTNDRLLRDIEIIEGDSNVIEFMVR